MRRAGVACAALCAAFLVPSTATAVAAPAHGALAPRTSSATHTYTVTTTADDSESSTAPAHTCQDSSNSSVCSFRAAIAAANADFAAASGVTDVIKVPSGTYDLSAAIDANPPEITNAGNLEIEGVGSGSAVIQGKTDSYSNGLLEAVGNGIDLYVSDLSFRGGEAPSGGAIYISGPDSLSVEKCIFLDDNASASGGAIAAIGFAQASVSDSTFDSDSTDGLGGAIYGASSTPLGIFTDDFHNDTAKVISTSSGGAIYTSGPAVVQNSYFLDNDSVGSGGAVFSQGALTLGGDQFVDNGSTTEDGGAVWGGSFVSDTSSSYTGNTAAVAGGAVELEDGGDISHDTFSTNSSAINGGDIDGAGLIQIIDSSSDRSHSVNAGGSLQVEARSFADLTNDVFTSDYVNGVAELEGGGALSAGSTADLRLTNVTVTRSLIDSDNEGGGALLCDGCVASISDSTFTDDHAGQFAGAFYLLDGAYVTIENTTISNNYSAQAGAFEVDTDSSVSITDSTLDGNVAQFTGGGVAMVTNGSFSLSDSTVAHNVAATEGGAGGVLDLTQSTAVAYLNEDTVADNMAWSGGAFWVNDGAVSVRSTTIDANRATGPSGSPSTLEDIGGSVTTSGSIWSGSAGAMCTFVSAVLVSGGFNLSTEELCATHGLGDIRVASAELNPLANYGGGTDTEPPQSTSPAIGSGGLSCEITDQRGVRTNRPAIPCDIGSVYVAATSVALSLNHPVLSHGAEPAEVVTVKVRDLHAPWAPSGSVSVMDGSRVVCVAHLSTPSADRGWSHGTCHLAAGALPRGVAHLRAVFAAHGDDASSRSPSVAVRVEG